ncbi:MAG: hypothetical protein Hyperionvirus2_97 [Hyperionvirus sp.]|uniref:Uncharacterized protein n=1 Tax=Hyperionvirus sp. TaxID=2487770 RepID=A0A3G5ABQ7_9VIRU|nr:MAG: hypothetical protein Hyperionvirus2_97 [Hyperionvirus sp.]
MESAMSSLTNELIHCTSLTDLHFTSQYRLRDPCRETIGKMTWLRKLISDDKQLLIFHLNQLTNLTYLERNALDGHIGAASLMSLQTLIVTGRCHPDIKFPLCPLENLTHLEIENYAHLNVCYLRNLTHLNVRVTHLPSNRELGEFKRLKKLIVSHNLDSSVRSRCSEGIDISVMSSLISLEILFCGVDMYFHMGRDGFVSLSLEQLRIETFGSNIDDSTLLRIPNLKYLRIGTDSCPRVTGVCFGSLAKLFEVSIGASDNLEEGCIDSLRRRGIIIKR